MPHRLRVIAAYLFVMLLAALLSGFIYLNDQRLQTSTDQLFSHSLPLLRHINQLRSLKLEHERLLYEYYATTDRFRLLPAIERVQHEIEQHFRHLEQQQLPMVGESRTDFLHLTTTAQQLDNNLKAQPINWDQAREQLILLSAIGRSMDPYLDQMVEQVEAQAEGNSMASQARIRWGTRLVIGFLVTISALALLVGFFVDRYLRETAERKRLAMFAERNPNPVLSINFDQSISYLNPAAQTLTGQLRDEYGENSREPAERRLLPEKLGELIASQQQQSQGSLAIGPYTFDYTLSLLPDLKLGHLYLKDISEQRRAEQQLEHRAKHDPLTQLPNRQQLEICIEQQLGSPLSERSDHHFHLVLLNIHQFNRITANYGYQFGDRLLRLAAQRFKKELETQPLLRPGLCRMDGCHFAFMLHSELPSNAVETVKILGQQLIDSMQEPLRLDDNEFHLSLCLGASQAFEDSDNVSGLLTCADAALMESTKGQGNNVVLYSQNIHRQNTRHLLLESEMRQALKENNFALFYQPKLDTKSNGIHHCEALMRWLDNGELRYSPGEFIPVAEQSGLIIPLGYWALDNAFAQVDLWRQSTPMITAINLSQRQFQHHQFLEKLEQLRQEYPGIEPYIEFEITESLLMQDINHSISIMQRIKDMGFALSIDDFGTGYSSLSYLKDFPIDKLKVDRSFIIDMTSNPEDKMLVETIIQLAHSLQLTTVAEGVETQEQLDQLLALNCEEIQGYLISKPLPVDAFNDFIAQYVS